MQSNELLSAKPFAAIHLQDASGRNLSSVRVQQLPFRIGRAVDNELILNDKTVAGEHLVLQADELGKPKLVVGQSLNGVRLGNKTYRSGETIPHAGINQTLWLGDVRIVVQMANEKLSVEQPVTAKQTIAMVMLMVLIYLGAHIFSDITAIELGDKYWLNLLNQLAIAFAALFVWNSLWAIINKLFSRKTNFFLHTYASAKYLSVFTVLIYLAAFISFSFDLDRAGRNLGYSVIILGTLLVYRHCSICFPEKRLPIASSITTLSVLLGIFVLVNHYQDSQSLDQYPYSEVILPARLYLGSPINIESNVSELTKIRERLQKIAHSDDSDSKDDE